MIKLYTRLHHEDNAARIAMGEKPNHCPPVVALAIGAGTVMAGFTAIFCVFGYIYLVLS